MTMHDLKKVLTAGQPLEETGKALVLLHGRGASARDILSLKQMLQVGDLTLFVPEAFNHSWYPYSFMAPVDQNQPALDAALSLLRDLVDDIASQGVASTDLYFLGFSQGACLTLEYTARHAKRYGGIVAFTGGLIGEILRPENYTGDFEQTPVLLTTGDPDPHVPLHRVEESKLILESMNAGVHVYVYKDRFHTILQEEIDLANKLVFAPRR